MRTTESKAAAAARIGAGLAGRKRAELLGLLKSCFVRTETWQHAGRYVSALVSELPRWNGWTIAEHAGDRSPDRTQRLLNRASWDTFAAMGQVRRFAAAGLDAAARRGRRRGGLVIGAIDETGQEKAGGATAGVKRQYLGCAGKVANGINTVHLSYVRDRTGHALIGALAVSTPTGSGPYFVMITDPCQSTRSTRLQGEGCAAVHLPFDHLGPVDVALDDA